MGVEQIYALFDVVHDALLKIDAKVDNMAVKIDHMNSRLDDMGKRLDSLDNVQASRDKSYMEHLKPISAACVKAKKYDIQWPLREMENLKAIEEKMGFLVSKL